MFGKKTNRNESKLETQSDHRVTGFGNISSVFRGNSNESKKETTVEKLAPDETILMSESDLPPSSTSKSVRLIQEVQKLEDRTIKPFVDFNEGNYFTQFYQK